MASSTALRFDPVVVLMSLETKLAVVGFSWKRIFSPSLCPLLARVGAVLDESNAKPAYTKVGV